MRRTPIVGPVVASISINKDKLVRRPKRIFYKIKGIPENKVVALKKYWNTKLGSEHEQSERMHKKSLQQVLAQPFEEKAVLNCLNDMLSNKDHPYGMVVHEFGREVINSFEGGDWAKVLADIKGRIDSFAKSMAGTAFLQYNDILSRVPLSEFTALCQDAVYEVLLSREPNVILDYYHTRFAKQDHALCSLSETVANILTPEHLDIQEKFWLIPKSGYTPPPYCAAISIFQQFSLSKSPLAKVAVVRDTARSICLSVEQFWDTHRNDFPQGEEASISADDLVAIFSFVILKSKVRLLYSESEYMCDFISDRNLMGETGYLITTLQFRFDFILI